MKLLSRVQLLATPWTAACQAPPSMGFSRQEYWGGLPLWLLSLLILLQRLLCPSVIESVLTAVVGSISSDGSSSSSTSDVGWNNNCCGTSLVVQWLAFHCRGHGFDPWSGYYDPTCCGAIKPTCHNQRAHESLCAATREKSLCPSIDPICHRYDPMQPKVNK